MGELIDLDTRRREKWIEKIIEMRELGKVAVFGTIGEVEADILPFTRKADNVQAIRSEED